MSIDQEEKKLDLINIVENRKLPCLLIFDGNNGEIILRNQLIDCNFKNEEEYQDLIEKLFDDFPFSSLINQSEGSTKDAFSLDSSIKTVICTDIHCYSIVGFTLSNELEGENTERVAILVEEIAEEISSERFGLHRHCDHFHITPRETEVIKELHLGRTDKMIASELKISPETVRGYLKSIRGKLGVSTRTAIINKLLTNRL